MRNLAPGFNDAENPLTWLRARRGRDGRPLISEVQYLAGERLRFAACGSTGNSGGLAYALRSMRT